MAVVPQPAPSPATLGYDIQPQYVNRFHIAISGDVIRVIFGDSAIGTDTTYHTAVVMSIVDGQQLADALKNLVAQHRLQNTPSTTAQ